MNDKSDILDPLFSDSGAFDETEAVKALTPHLTIQRATNKIYLKDVKLSTTKKILAYALAKKLLKLRNLIESDEITAQEFHEASGINKGTVDPSFKTLKDKSFLIGKLKYELAVSKVPTIISLLNSKKEE